MKTLVVGPQFPDSFARNISVTLDAMGHHVTSVEGVRAHHYGGRLRNLWWTYGPKALPAIERVAYREMIRGARGHNPDLILVTFGFMPPEVVSELRDW